MLHYLKYMADGKVGGNQRKLCLTSEGWLAVLDWDWDWDC